MALGITIQAALIREMLCETYTQATRLVRTELVKIDGKTADENSIVLDGGSLFIGGIKVAGPISISPAAPPNMDTGRRSDRTDIFRHHLREVARMPPNTGSSGYNPGQSRQFGQAQTSGDTLLGLVELQAILSEMNLATSAGDLLQIGLRLEGRGWRVARMPQ